MATPPTTPTPSTAPAAAVAVTSPGPSGVPASKKPSSFSPRRLPFLFFLTLATFAFCYPLVWLVSASLKPRSQVFGSAFYVFLLRQFFLGIPRELFEAARVDGCGYFGMFRRVAFPLCKPALVIVFVFEFKASWSDLMKPLIYLQTPEYFTMPRGLKQIIDAFALSGHYEWELAVAASVIAVVPMIILFAFGQRYILDGVATTAQKG